MILVCGNPHTVPAFGFSAYEIECNSGDAYYRAHANGEAVGKIGPQIIRVETTHQVNLIKVGEAVDLWRKRNLSCVWSYCRCGECRFARSACYSVPI